RPGPPDQYSVRSCWPAPPHRTGPPRHPPRTGLPDHQSTPQPRDQARAGPATGPVLLPGPVQPGLPRHRQQHPGPDWWTAHPEPPRQTGLLHQTGPPDQTRRQTGPPPTRTAGPAHQTGPPHSPAPHQTRQPGPPPPPPGHAHPTAHQHAHPTGPRHQTGPPPTRTAGPPPQTGPPQARAATGPPPPQTAASAPDTAEAAETPETRPSRTRTSAGCGQALHPTAPQTRRSPPMP